MFNSLPLCIDKWLIPLPTGWKLSFGVWVRFTVDPPGVPPTVASSENVYVHSQLEERHQFRLLELHPGSPGDTIKATLVTKDLRDAPSYEAMSYVWGDMNDRVDILVNGRNFKITKNLHDALENLKSPTSIRILWTDQVCINQYHNTEKQDQVHMMDEIYKAADGVVVYLGQSTEQTETDMQHLQSFMERYGQREESPWSHIAVPELEQSSKKRC
ncbi:hypothetical protein J4E90_008236 [Alternaria incomplexa]|uniref:uncharacterized protein n=1 Tax=Alternaria incomplexa TaxID=1187928 RepID=UPI00222079F3|nr:uncharacterized protein J4E90_008236 [Alternaria incomplexa]KAI4909539.1 hypothetical protein J4E90_008236 [Alternaria incomplexa]